MKDETIPIKKEETTREAEQDSVFQGSDQADERINRRLIPIDTPTVGRDLKLSQPFTLSGTVDVLISEVTVANTADESTLWSFLVQPDEWHPKMVIRIHADGIYSTANASDTFTLRVKIGSSTMVSVVSTAASATNAAWSFIFYGTVRTIGSGTAARIEGGINADINDVKKSSVETTPTTFASTSSQTLSVTVEWSNALSGNTLSIEQCFLEVLN